MSTPAVCIFSVKFLLGPTGVVPGAAICASIGELTKIGLIQIHDEDLVLATRTWPEGHEKYFAPGDGRCA